MKSAAFKGFLAGVETLTRTQMERLSTHVEAVKNRTDSRQILRGHEPRSCPHCQGKLVRNGCQNGLQRFRCKACSKSSCATTLTPLWRLRGKEMLPAYAASMALGETVRTAANRLGFSTNRAFRWRHRFLANPVSHQPFGVTGLFEVDEIDAKHSRKGEHGLLGPRHRGGPAASVPVLVGRARGRKPRLTRCCPT